MECFVLDVIGWEKLVKLFCLLVGNVEWNEIICFKMCVWGGMVESVWVVCLGWLFWLFFVECVFDGD